jgi:hypothetical protein
MVREHEHDEMEVRREGTPIGLIVRAGELEKLHWRQVDIHTAVFHAYSLPDFYERMHLFMACRMGGREGFNHGALTVSSFNNDASSCCSTPLKVSIEST